MRKLFEPNARAIGRPPGPPACDAVPDSMIDGTPSELRDDLMRLLGKKQVLDRVIDLVRYAADASPYRLLPKVVVMPRNVDDVAKILAYCRETGRHAIPPNSPLRENWTIVSLVNRILTRATRPLPQLTNNRHHFPPASLRSNHAPRYALVSRQVRADVGQASAATPMARP